MHRVTGEGGTDELTDLPSGIVVSGSLIGTQIVTPASPPEGFCAVYFKMDGNLYILDPSGYERSVQGTAMLHADSHLLDTGGRSHPNTSVQHPGKRPWRARG